MQTLRGILLALLLVAAILPACAADRDIYPDPSQARADIDAAFQQARQHHKRVLLDFGGNWCPDCRVLDIYFHDATNAPLIQKNFLLVHVNIGHMDRNQDIAEKYGIPLKKGVPALAVVRYDGQVLYSQQAGEFEAMRSMQSSAVTEFLVKWKPSSRSTGCSVLVQC